MSNEVIILTDGELHGGEQRYAVRSGGRVAFGVWGSQCGLPDCEEGGVRYITHYAMSGRIYATRCRH